MDVGAELSGALLVGLGFNTATNSGLSEQLKLIHPHGGTALRDSLVKGSKLLIDLNNLLEQLGKGNIWNMVHVILTDGLDEHSTTTLSSAI